MLRKTIPNKATVLTKAVIKTSNNASSVWLPVRVPELGLRGGWRLSQIFFFLTQSEKSRAF